MIARRITTPAHLGTTACTSYPLPDTAFDWTVADTTIASLDPSRNGVFLHALRPGRTSVRVAGVLGPSDTISWRQALSDSLESDLLVIDVPARIVIEPITETVHVGTATALQIRVFGTDGQHMAEAPVMVRAWHEGYVRGWSPGQPISFDRPGRWTVTASIGELADSIVVTVIEPEPGGGSRRLPEELIEQLVAGQVEMRGHL